jgi:hypothetical protein
VSLLDDIGSLFGFSSSGTTDSAAGSSGTAFPSAPVPAGQLVSPNMAASAGNSGGSQVTPGAMVPQGGGGIGSWFGNANFSKMLPLLIGGGGILNSAIRGSGSTPQLGPMKDIAGQTKNAGQQMINAANAGQLPPGQEQQLDQQLAAQIAAIKAKYAGMGLSGSSMEQQDIQGVQAQSQADKQRAVQSYMDAGLKDIGIAGQDYSAIGQLQMKQQEDMAQQIAAFLQAMTGGTGKGS